MVVLVLLVVLIFVLVVLVVFVLILVLVVLKHCVLLLLCNYERTFDKAQPALLHKSCFISAYYARFNINYTF